MLTTLRHKRAVFDCTAGLQC